ncbi:glycoside hydrolase family 43 protein [Pseudovirgaria hyperparasitica]|uniref:Glycoside hydrolase family 43 protein n=1 Tax=Pseudovirgaria hyperparasitica TaxID=470096 RepID=A0A6A6W2D8_9PEZI|nr:glycoside hydrolase family 43 protein [Pseudovirgaria hyperparasitica]KAF2755191.1 glycoside hydrolase family 43 protein [Pseudovirgaria hyperparasitica]
MLYNPIIPGFYPDPSCIFVPEWDNTFFCASSSFNAFPGVPIHASKDLQNWKLIGNALNRPEQLPGLAHTNGSTSGVWAPTLRYHDGLFYIITTNVFDNKAIADPAKWDNFIISAKDPFDPASWTEGIHFPFQGYDTSLFWHENGKVYVTGSHYHRIKAGIRQTTIDLTTGELGGEFQEIWLGTGGIAVEGPHIYQRDGWYYLLAAEGGTGVNHMVTMARSKDIMGPYEGDTTNPLLTNANTTQYFQTVGHADLFQDKSENWWGVALSTRSGPKYENYPMGRETIMVPVTWDEGKFPVFSNATGAIETRVLPTKDVEIKGTGPLCDASDRINFTAGSVLPVHFLHWRFPEPSAYVISPTDHPNILQLTPSKLNLTGLDGASAATPQTFVGRRQTHTLFTYSVILDYVPKTVNEEAGITAFLTQNHHIRLGVTLLQSSNPMEPVLSLSFYAISSKPVPEAFTVPLPLAWQSQPLKLEIKAYNLTHYTFSAGPADAQSEMQTFANLNNEIVSYGFTGTLLGVYATSNGGEGKTAAYVSKWRYTGQGQFRD